MKNTLLAMSCAMLLAACGSSTPTKENDRLANQLSTNEHAKLSAIISAQAAATKERYQYRHPLETLSFFQIEPGMTVVEVLPGQGWYSSILVPYLGQEGHLIGADYALDMFQHFDWATEEFLQNRSKWGQEWTAKAKEWAPTNTPRMSAYNMDSFPSELDGKVDAILFIRALHNMSRFEDKGQYLSKAIEQSQRLLKTGGIVGIVQHQAPEDKSDAWSDGSMGYLKKSNLISLFEEAGFELVGDSAINSNPKDIPGLEDSVWRLPPAMYTTKEGDPKRADYQAIGESNRMTLKFRKK